MALGAGVSCCGSSTDAAVCVTGRGERGRDDKDGGGGGGGIALPFMGPGGGGGGGPAIMPLNGGGGGGGVAATGGGGGGGDLASPAMCACEGFLVGLVASLPPRKQLGQLNFCVLCWRSRRTASSAFSMSVARCTSRSVVSQMTSLSGSFESMPSRCCNMLRNGPSGGLSAT